MIVYRLDLALFIIFLNPLIIGTNKRSIQAIIVTRATIAAIIVSCKGRGTAIPLLQLARRALGRPPTSSLLHFGMPSSIIKQARSYFRRALRAR